MADPQPRSNEERAVVKLALEDLHSALVATDRIAGLLADFLYDPYNIGRAHDARAWRPARAPFKRVYGVGQHSFEIHEILRELDSHLGDATRCLENAQLRALRITDAIYRVAHFRDLPKEDSSLPLTDRESEILELLPERDEVMKVMALEEKAPQGIRWVTLGSHVLTQLRMTIDRATELLNAHRRDDSLAHQAGPLRESGDTASQESARRREYGWWIPAALNCLRKHPEWPDVRIAREVGVNPSTLSRNEIYRRARRFARDTGRTPRRGRITHDESTGLTDVEATD